MFLFNLNKGMDACSNELVVILKEILIGTVENGNSYSYF